jgi:hypothetical protein
VLHLIVYRNLLLRQLSALLLSADGPFRHSRLVRDLVACGEQQTLICTCAEWLGRVRPRADLVHPFVPSGLFIYANGVATIGAGPEADAATKNTLSRVIATTLGLKLSDGIKAA